MVKVQQKGLGRGLSALINDTDTDTMTATPQRSDNLSAPSSGLIMLEIALEQLTPSPYQPRTHFDDARLHELSQSIEKNGIMQPILVRSLKQSGMYEIIAGERRWRAAKMAGLTAVPVHVREMDDAQALEIALIENIQRQDLNPVEEAIGFRRLMDEFAYTQEELSEAIGKSRSHIANLLRVLTLPESIKEMLATGALTLGHAKALMSAANPELLAKIIIEKQMSVRQAEQLAKTFGGGTETERKPRAPRAGQSSTASNSNQPKDPDIIALEQTLAENLGLKVNINDLGGKSGEIVISYESLTQLDEVLKRLGGGV